jgi:uncharacterized beta barrel domain-containing protein DUF5777
MIKAACLCALFNFHSVIMAQNTDSTAIAANDSLDAPLQASKPKPVRELFESVWIIDNQTVIVPIQKTFEMDINHRFGTLENGYKDFYGLFASSNIRLGFSYVPMKDLMVGVAITKANMTWEGYAKYAILKQTKGQYPVSISYYGNMAVDTRTKDHFVHGSDRLMYFNQVMIARKINKKLTVQVAPSVSHQNVVNGYYETSGSVADSTYKAEVKGEMKHNHYALAISARYKIKEKMSLLFNYDQPLTRHPSNNPNPNLSLGIEFTTSSHAFQVFFTNFYYLTPQRNNLFNKNNPITIKNWNDITFYPGHFLIGFNITRLWNY